MRERSLGSAIATALQQSADAYRTGAVIIEGARMHLTTVVRTAEQHDFTVHDDGTVDASSQIALLHLLLPDRGRFEIARVRIERDAAVLTVAVLDALLQADAAARETSTRITTAIASADDVARSIARGVGPFATAIGTVPAIKNDIEGGMEPVQAVVTESVGSAVGIGAAFYGAKGGAALGTMIAPGFGTAVGLLAGALAGAGATYLTSKSMQVGWQWLE